jgi:3',5'-cyclic AMP phosphodiesterase CpdA
VTRAVVVQLSDPHVGADWDGRDPAAALAATVECVVGLDLAPVAVLVTGDIAGHALDAEYELARELLAPLGAPLHVLPGNHDDRAGLRRHFALPGDGGEPVLYAVDAGPLRLVVLDSTRPGEDAGELDRDRLEWLDATLAEAAAPTLLALHHPPLVTGFPAIDDIGLPASDRAVLAGVVARHPHVRRIVAGHVHRAVAAELGGCCVLAVPSTYVQLRLDLASGELEPSDEPAGFALHVVTEGELASHVVTVDRTR